MDFCLYFTSPLKKGEYLPESLKPRFNLKMTNQSVQDELLKRGRGKIKWTESNMRMLGRLREEFSSTKPFAGLTIGVSLHIEQKTAALFKVLVAGGAEVVATDNLGTTQDDIAAALNDSGIRVYGKRNDTRREHLENVRQILRHKPNLLLDNGADLIAFLIEEKEFSGQKVLGGQKVFTSFLKADLINEF